MEQLKAQIAEDIKLQTRLRKLMIASLIVGAIIYLSALVTVLYFVLRPSPASLVTLQHIEIQQKTVTLELKLIQSEKIQLQKDREDVRVAREQVLEMEKLLETKK